MKQSDLAKSLDPIIHMIGEVSWDPKKRCSWDSSIFILSAKCPYFILYITPGTVIFSDGIFKQFLGARN